MNPEDLKSLSQLRRIAVQNSTVLVDEVIRLRSANEELRSVLRLASEVLDIVVPEDGFKAIKVAGIIRSALESEG